MVRIYPIGWEEAIFGLSWAQFGHSPLSQREPSKTAVIDDACGEMGHEPRDLLDAIYSDVSRLLSYNRAEQIRGRADSATRTPPIGCS